MALSTHMLNPAIYRTLFNLDKNRKDLPAGNPAVPYQTAPLAGSDEGDIPPAPVNIKPYQPVPKPPGMTKPNEQVAVTAEETIGPMDDTATETETVTQPLPRGVEWDEKSRRGREAEQERLSKLDFSKTGDDAPTLDEQQRYRRNQTSSRGVKQSSEQRNAFFGEGEPVSGNAPAISMAEREAELQKQAVLALGGSAAAGPEANAVPENWGTPKQMKRAKKEYEYAEKLKAALPYENPQTEAERRANRTAELKFKAENPHNEDRGVKGFIRETLQNFLYGLSKAQGVPGISIGQALMLGGVGAGGGMLNRGWNEQRAAQDALPGAEKDLAMELDREKSDRAFGIQEAGLRLREDAQQFKVDEAAAERQWKEITQGWKERDRQEYYKLQREKLQYTKAKDEENARLAQRRIALLEERNGVLKAQGDRRLDQVDAKQGTSTKSATPRPRVQPKTKAEAGAVATKLQEKIDAAIANGNQAAAGQIQQQLDKFLQSISKLK